MPVVHWVVTRLITDKAPARRLIVCFDLPDVDQVRSSAKATDTIELRVQTIISSFTSAGFLATLTYVLPLLKSSIQLSQNIAPKHFTVICLYRKGNSCLSCWFHINAFDKQKSPAAIQTSVWPQGFFCFLMSQTVQIILSVGQIEWTIWLWTI